MRTKLLPSALGVAALLAPAMVAQSASSVARESSAGLAALGSSVRALELPEAPVPESPSAAGGAHASNNDPEMPYAFLPPCPTVTMEIANSSEVASAAQSGQPCLVEPNPYQRFLDTTAPIPLTPRQKARLALHNMEDPGNLLTIVGTAAFTIGTESHTAYGPGWKGFGSNASYSLLQDATGEFFGTFLIPALAHEDPHYHRIPHATVPRRFLHAIVRTVVAQSDHGHRMPNYANLFGTVVDSEISNLYIPGIHGNGPSTVARIMTGYATDPIGNLITEFLPDVARHVHVQVIFVQRILNGIASDQYALP